MNFVLFRASMHKKGTKKSVRLSNNPPFSQKDETIDFGSDENWILRRRKSFGDGRRFVGPEKAHEIRWPQHELTCGTAMSARNKGLTILQVRVLHGTYWYSNETPISWSYS